MSLSYFRFRMILPAATTPPKIAPFAPYHVPYLSVIPYRFFLVLPYVPGIVAMVIMSRRATYPKALLVPFRRGERI